MVTWGYSDKIRVLRCRSRNYDDLPINSSDALIPDRIIPDELYIFTIPSAQFVFFLFLFGDTQLQKKKTAKITGKDKCDKNVNVSNRLGIQATHSLHFVFGT